MGMGKEYPLAASCCLKSECIFEDLTTTPSYCLKRILFVLLHTQYVHKLQLRPQGPAGDQSRAPKRCRCREASPCHAEASSTQYHHILTSASQIRLIFAQQLYISQLQLPINSNSKLGYLKSSGKDLLLQHLPKPSIQTGGGYLTILGALAVPARHCYDMGKVGLDYRGKH